MTRRLWAAFLLACMSATAIKHGRMGDEQLCRFHARAFFRCVFDERWEDRAGSAA